MILNRVDYGPMRPEMVAILENMRTTLSPEKRLLMAKFLARTVSVDGTPSEQEAAKIVDATITANFQEKYPPES